MKTEIKFILIVIGISAILFIGIPLWIWNGQVTSDITKHELHQVRGQLRSIEKSWTGGKHKERIIYVNINNLNVTFKISGSNYRALKSDILNMLLIGEQITLSVKENEFKRATAPSIIDKTISSVLEWWKQPQIYELSTEKTDFLTISDYNNEKEDFNSKNFYWGIAFVIFIVCRLGWEVYKGNQESRSKNKKSKKRAVTKVSVAHPHKIR